MSTHTPPGSSHSRKPPTRKSGSRRGGSGGSNAAERTVRRLRLSKALTLPDTTSVADACRRMATRRVAACLLTDSSALLCGIMTDKDLAIRCLGEGLSVETTPVSRIMTKNPHFVTIDSSAVDALQKMVTGRFRHLPVVDNGEVVALLDITKCLYDAIARLERAAEKGQAIAAAIEGVEKQWGQSSGFSNTFKDKIFRPTLASIIGDQTRSATVQKTDAVLKAARRMREFKVSSVIVTNGVNNRPIGILTSKDILTRVLALGLRPEETMVEQIMTPNPESVHLDTTIVDALHTMHDGKFLHLPVVDRDGNCVAAVDVLDLTHGAMTAAAGPGSEGQESSALVMKKFWDSALALEPVDVEEDNVSTRSSDFDHHHHIHATTAAASHGGATAHAADAGKNSSLSFAFKMEDRKGRVHRFSCGSESMTELVCAVVARLGSDYNPDHPPAILYEDEEGDKVMITTDDDLSGAVKFARAMGKKGLKLHLDYREGEEDEEEEEAPRTPPPTRKSPMKRSPKQKPSHKTSRRNSVHHEPDDNSLVWTYGLSMVAVSTIAVASTCVAIYLHRSNR